MSFKFDFEEGKSVIESYCSEMFEAAHSVISDSLNSDCAELMSEQRWEHLRGYLVSCFTQMLDNMIPQLRNELEEFVNGDGGFVSFASNTLNSDDAVEYARHVTDNLLEAPDTLNSCQDDIDAIATLPATATGDPDVIRERLTELFQRSINTLEGYRIDYGNRIGEEADENAFVAPLASVPEILFGLIGAWYESLLASVDPFCEGALALGNASKEAAQSYKEQASQQARNKAQDISYGIE